MIEIVRPEWLKQSLSSTRQAIPGVWRGVIRFLQTKGDIKLLNSSTDFMGYVMIPNSLLP